MVRLQDFVKVEGRGQDHCDRGGNRGWVVRGYGRDLGVTKTGRYRKVLKRSSWCPEITRNRENSSVRVMAWLTVRQNIPEDQQGEVGELDEGEGIGGC